MTFDRAMKLYAAALVFAARGCDPVLAVARAAKLVEKLDDMEGSTKEGPNR